MFGCPDPQTPSSITTGGFLSVSASGGPHRASGASINDSGCRAGHGERVGTSGGDVMKKSLRRGSGEIAETRHVWMS
eukprot:4199732-Pyramimonas_sp.AAC.1